MYQREEILEDIWTDDKAFDMNFCFDDVVDHATFFDFKKFKDFFDNEVSYIRGFIENIEEEYEKKFFIIPFFPIAVKQAWKIYNNHLRGKYRLDPEEYFEQLYKVNKENNNA